MVMIHPNQEDWMSFIYGEDSPDLHRQREEHLRACASCSAQMNRWRTGAQALDEWTLPSPGPVAAQGTSWKWAAAAALVLGAGIAIGIGMERLAAPSSPDIAALRDTLTRDFDQRIANARTEWAAELRQSQSAAEQKLFAEVLEKAGLETQRWIAGYGKDLEDQRLSEKEALVTTLRQFDAKYAASLARLRKELETVAVNTQDGFTETEERLGQLASFGKPSDLPPR